LVGDPKAGVRGWLGDWDPDSEDAMLPFYVEEARKQLGEWIGQQSTWYAGDWVQYPELCRWQVYQEVGLLIKARLRGKRACNHQRNMC
jgi:hypothetical protein